MVKEACPVDAAFAVLVTFLSLLTCFVTFLCGRHLYNQWKNHPDKLIPDSRYQQCRAVLALSVPISTLMIVIVHIVHTMDDEVTFWTCVSLQLISSLILTGADKMAEFWKLHGTFQFSVYQLSDIEVRGFMIILGTGLLLGIPWGFRFLIFEGVIGESAISTFGLSVGLTLTVTFAGLLIWIFIQFENRLISLIVSSDGAIASTSPGSLSPTSPTSPTSDFRDSTDPIVETDEMPPLNQMNSTSLQTRVANTTVARHLRLVSKQTLSDIRVNEQKFVKLVAKESALSCIMIVSLCSFAAAVTIQSMEKCPSLGNALLISLFLWISLGIKCMARFHFRELKYEKDYFRWFGWMDRWHVKMVILHAKREAGVDLDLELQRYKTQDDQANEEQS